MIRPGLTKTMPCAFVLGDKMCRANPALIADNPVCRKTIFDCIHYYDNVEHFGGFQYSVGELGDQKVVQAARKNWRNKYGKSDGEARKSR